MKPIPMRPAEVEVDVFAPRSSDARGQGGYQGKHLTRKVCAERGRSLPPESRSAGSHTATYAISAKLARGAPALSPFSWRVTPVSGEAVRGDHARVRSSGHGRHRKRRHTKRNELATSGAASDVCECISCTFSPSLLAASPWCVCARVSAGRSAGLPARCLPGLSACPLPRCVSRLDEERHEPLQIADDLGSSCRI